MTPLELKQVDAVLASQLDILRHASSTEGRVLLLLEHMQRRLTSKITSGKLTEFGKARMNALLKETTTIIDATYAKIRAEVEKSLFGVAKAAARSAGVVLPIDKLEVSLGAIDARLGYKLVNLDIDSFDAAFAQNKGFYVGRNGSGGIAGRYERVKKFIAEKEAFEASTVVVNPDGSVGFDNGRHRYAAIRDAGNRVIPVAMTEESLANAKAAGYLASSTAPASFSVGLATGVLSDVALEKLVSAQLVEGAPSAAWWAKQSGDTSFRFAGIVRQGIVQGETNEQIFRRTKELIDLAGRNSRALVQTSVMQAASDARVAIIDGNTDIYKGYRHLSTLDGHTTEVCIARSNLTWDLDGKPQGHNLPFKPPPVHWNCRSVMLGVLKTFKEMGIDLPEVKGTRSSAEGQVDQDTTFEAFLGRRTEAQQDAQLGVGRAELWRQGKITLRQLVDNSGNALTLSQLKSKYD